MGRASKQRIQRIITGEEQPISHYTQSTGNRAIRELLEPPPEVVLNGKRLSQKSDSMFLVGKQKARHGNDAYA